MIVKHTALTAYLHLWRVTSHTDHLLLLLSCLKVDISTGQALLLASHVHKVLLRPIFSETLALIAALVVWSLLRHIILLLSGWQVRALCAVTLAAVTHDLSVRGRLWAIYLVTRGSRGKHAALTSICSSTCVWGRLGRAWLLLHIILVVIIQHVSQNVLGVFQSLCHLSIIAV